MKTEDYIHLITVTEAEAKMIREVLWKHKIPSKLYPTSETDVLAGRGVSGILPYKVYIPKESLEKVKQIFNLEETKEIISVPEEKHGYPRWVALIAWIFILIVIIFGLIFLLE